MKKPSLAVLIGMGKSHDADEASSDDDQAYADAGDEALHAVKSGDGKAFADALCALMDLHASSKSDAEDPDDEEKY